MTRNHVLIIAEAGVNHNGDLEKAKELIHVAKGAGADFVKFQTFKADKIVSKEAKKASYQKLNLESADDSQYEMLKALELSEAAHDILVEECEKAGIHFLSTAFDLDGIDYLDNLGIPFYKIPSGELTNYPYLKRIAQKGKPVILSTGMATLEEIKWAVGVLEKFGVIREHITVLHCNTEYPTPMHDVNLNAMRYIADELGVKIGYSDHTMGIEVPIAAVAMGAQVIEKHFTLDRTLPGPDHKASLEPDELKAMVSSIRNIEKAVGGSGIKEPSESELKNKVIARKSIHTAYALPIGHTITDSDVIALRPGDGISAIEWENVIGKKTKYALAVHTKLEWELIE